MNTLFYLYSISLTILFFICSRGEDGRLSVLLFGFTLIFLIYSFALYKFQIKSYAIVIWNYLFAIVFTIPIFVKSSLQEMAGLIYLIIIFFLIFGFILNCLELYILKKKKFPFLIKQR